MEDTVKITVIHIVTALISGYVSYLFTLGLIPGLGTNEMFAGVLGIIILYFTGQLSDRLFGKEKGFSAWLWDGIVPFVFTWFVTWTLLTNYLGIL